MVRVKIGKRELQWIVKRPRGARALDVHRMVRLGEKVGRTDEREDKSDEMADNSGD